MRPGAVPPDEAHAAAQRSREVVGMALQRQAELEQLVGREIAPGDRRTGDEARGDRGRGGAEPALERDPVHETEAAAARRREERKGTQREVLLVLRQLPCALALDLDRG